MITKDEARKQIKEFRSTVDIHEVDYMSRKACDNLMSLPEYRLYSTIFAYCAVNNEVDTTQIIMDALDNGKTVALPRVVDGDIVFYAIRNLDDLEFGFMGIPEPPERDEYKIDKDDVFVVIPGLAFDSKGNRSGYGKGFYDRFLANHPGCLKVGFAFEKQIFDELENNEHDIGLDLIVTENRIVDCRKH